MQNVVRGGRVVRQVHPDDVYINNVIARRMMVPGLDDSDDIVSRAQTEAELRQQLALARRNIVYQEVQKAEGLTQQVAMLNLQSKERNQRAIYALAQLSGAEVEPATPTAWWSWWNDENERYQQEKPTITRYTAYSDPYQVENVPAHECFPAGTLVRTQLGPSVIESLSAGDRVLSQDIETGELAYKMVIATTERPPSDVVRIQSDRGSIESTTGHLFWVQQHGWKMAKNLRPNDQLLRLGGHTVNVEAVEKLEQAVAYNLVVADFGTFFVTEHDVLTHDNTERKRTKAIAPGVVRR